MLFDSPTPTVCQNLVFNPGRHVYPLTRRFADANQFRDAFLKAQKDSAHLFQAADEEEDKEEEEKTAA